MSPLARQSDVVIPEDQLRKAHDMCDPARELILPAAAHTSQIPNPFIHFTPIDIVKYDSPVFTWFDVKCRC